MLEKSKVEQIIPHIKYELAMLNQTEIYTRMTHRSSDFGMFVNPMVCNAFLESYLIHSRNIIEFLFADDKQKRSDSCTYTDFIVSDANRHKFEEYRSTHAYLKNDIIIRAHKALAHISFARIGYAADNADWNLYQIHSGIRSLFGMFVHFIDDTEIQALFNQILLEVYHDERLFNPRCSNVI